MKKEMTAAPVLLQLDPYVWLSPMQSGRPTHVQLELYCLVDKCQLQMGQCVLQPSQSHE